MRTAAVFCGLLGACATAPPAPAADPAPVALNAAVAYTRITISDASVVGASGLTRTRDGRFLAVLERAHKVVELKLDTQPPQLGRTWTVVGVPSELDLESIVELDEGTVLLGTESKTPDREQDLVFFGRYKKDTIEVIEEPLGLSYSAWGFKASKNRGIEGICTAGGRIVMAGEEVGTAEGRRYAPIASYDLLQRNWTYHRLFLSSDTGKISGLSCRTTANGLLVFGIERHYEVGRIVRFELSKGQASENLELEVVVDLSTFYAGKLANFEGLTMGDDAELILLSDNDYGGITGPTEVLRVQEPFTQQPGRRMLTPGTK